MVEKQDIENSFDLCMMWLYSLRVSNEFPILKEYEGRHYVEAKDITNSFTRDEFLKLARTHLEPLIVDTIDESSLIYAGKIHSACSYVLLHYDKKTND